ncbi:helix-turn-helix domain-containing protein [uncultured Roseobacter sp.]|uniref:AlbA family DNA-binding domain-containing protein n=1 Tax=uncultured Roseobacter sp. TaxID=114847 RepID=UPI002609225F|nr:ATP-binding protein [uncultured Roseobacter sp.]
MTTNQDLETLLTDAREDLSAEYKSWLNSTSNEHRAVFAKAAIALANHSGGYVIIGMEEDGDSFNSVQRPEEIPEITQDIANAEG